MSHTDKCSACGKVLSWYPTAPEYSKQLISDDRADLLVAREALDKIEEIAKERAPVVGYRWLDVAVIIQKAKEQFRAK